VTVRLRPASPSSGRGEKRFAGIFTPIPTPFREDDSVDEEGLRRNVARWIGTPLTGLVVLGSNGEAPQLEDAEADRIIDVVRSETPPSRPLIAGTGRESTRGTIAATRRAAAAGVDAVLVRTPSFFKPQLTSEVFVRHYLEVADASAVPVLLYNVAIFTGVNLPTEAVASLSSHPNICGIKESGSDIGRIRDYISRLPEDFTVLAGSGAALFDALCAGCDGAVVALAAIAPEECVRLRALVAEKRYDDARALQSRLMPLARSVGSAYGVPGLKAALDLLGFAGGPPRPPLRPVSSEAIDSLRSQLDALGLLPEDRSQALGETTAPVGRAHPLHS
jgi:4-hydroxy-2-oxoglutarate aldolase